MEPSQVTQLHTKVWVSQAGTYSLDGWRLESEVAEREQSITEGWQARHRYVQGHPQDGAMSCITVVDA